MDLEIEPTSSITNEFYFDGEGAIKLLRDSLGACRCVLTRNAVGIARYEIEQEDGLEAAGRSTRADVLAALVSSLKNVGWIWEFTMHE